MPTIKRPGVPIYYETMGAEDGRAIVLIAGLGEQIGSVEFPEEQCRQFVEAGFRVIRIDNRDVGLSVPEPDLPARDVMATFAAARSGKPVVPDYTLVDMADDVIAVVDALGLPQVDVVGASLGGFIARWVAIRHPQRVRSLTVVMSGSGTPPDASQQDESLLAGLLLKTIRADRTEVVKRMVSDWRSYWGNTFPFDEDWVRARCTFAFDRAYRPEAIGRAAIAVGTSPNLFEQQADIVAPTMIVHGSDDPVFGLEQANATHERIAGSQMWVVHGMGHSMPNEIWPEMTRRIAALAC